MKYERFLKITLGLQLESESLKKLYDAGIELYELVDPYHKIINELIKEVYGDDGYDWWSWFCWESDFGRKDWGAEESFKINEDGTRERVHEKGMPRQGAYDKEGNPICYSFESTWEYLEKNHKI